MHLRPYNEQTDFAYIAQWISDERTHALWCANLLSYPLSGDEFHNYLINQHLKFSFPSQSEIFQLEKEFDGAYVYADEKDRPVGFFIYTVSEQDKSGFLKFIMVDSKVRGKGYGAAMLRELLRFAYGKTGVSSVRLIVFDVNEAAYNCYKKAGFAAMENAMDAFSYQGETWGRVLMEHRLEKQIL